MTETTTSGDYTIEITDSEPLYGTPSYRVYRSAHHGQSWARPVEHSTTSTLDEARALADKCVARETARDIERARIAVLDNARDEATQSAWLASRGSDPVSRAHRAGFDHGLGTAQVWDES